MHLRYSMNKNITLHLKNLNYKCSYLSFKKIAFSNNIHSNITRLWQLSQLGHQQFEFVPQLCLIGQQFECWRHRIDFSFKPMHYLLVSISDKTGPLDRIRTTKKKLCLRNTRQQIGLTKKSKLHINIFGMATLPFLHSGTLLFQGNLPRVLPVTIYEYASCLIPYIDSFLFLWGLAQCLKISKSI